MFVSMEADLITVAWAYDYCSDTNKRVVGVLLGERSKGVVQVTNSYACEPIHPFFISSFIMTIPCLMIGFMISSVTRYTCARRQYHRHTSEPAVRVPPSSHTTEISWTILQICRREKVDPLASHIKKSMWTSGWYLIALMNCNDNFTHIYHHQLPKLLCLEQPHCVLALAIPNTLFVPHNCFRSWE